MRKTFSRVIAIAALVVAGLTFSSAPASAECADWAKVGWNGHCVQY